MGESSRNQGTWTVCVNILGDCFYYSNYFGMLFGGIELCCALCHALARTERTSQDSPPAPSTNQPIHIGFEYMSCNSYVYISNSSVIPDWEQG